MTQEPYSADFCCPGETVRISRAVHLARLVRSHRLCRHCPQSDDAIGLSARQIRHLADVARRAEKSPLFHAEGAGNVAINDLGRDVSRRIAIAFARRIAGPTTATRDRQPLAIIASDGRLTTAEILATIVEGLRWTGCQTIDIGPASGPCTARAIEHLKADGGIFVGRAGNAAHTVGLKFWAGGEPLSRGGLLDDVSRSVSARTGPAMIDRPVRRFGPLRRFAATEVYLNDLRPAYHALRPLRFVLDCSAAPVAAYLWELVRNVACRIILGENAGDRLGERVVAAEAHFGVRIDDDGENCRVVNEQGQAVDAMRLARLIAMELGSPVMPGEELRQQTFLRMRQSGETMAVNAAGRIWYAAGHAPLADALRTLTLLLVVLSRDDRALSERMKAEG